MRLSIIIPVYNCEKYISRCLDSVLKIGSSIDWECIVVDDGSQDKSGDIIDAYSLKDPRFVALHKKNSGVSDTRNIGIERATGDALFFIDADDWFLDTASDQLKEGLKRLENGTFTVFGHNNIYPNGRIENYVFPDIQSLCYREALRELAVKEQKLNTCWGILFKKDVIIQNNIRFDSNMRIAEDTCFVLDYVIHESNIYVDSRPIIAYWQREDSAIHRVGLESIIDDEKCYLKRKQMIDLLEINISEYDYNKMCNFYFSNTIGYLAIACSKMSIMSGVKQVKRYVESYYGIELIDNCDKASFSFSKKILVWALKSKLYLLCYILMKVYVRNHVRRTAK